MAGVRKRLQKEKTKGIVKASIQSDGEFSTDSFVKGFDCGITTSIKVLKDKLNKYKSWLQDETKVKLSKTANFEKIVSYKAYIKILEELIKDIENGKK